eukprot:SAG11_NODE_22214_length_410_cov_0.668810_1_plen_75_part_01
MPGPVTSSARATGRPGGQLRGVISARAPRVRAGVVNRELNRAAARSKPKAGAAAVPPGEPQQLAFVYPYGAPPAA